MAAGNEKAFVPVRVAVLTVSSTRTTENDTSGDLIVKFLSDAGHIIAGRAIASDAFEAIRDKMVAWAADPEVEVIISTGGTGITNDDRTPEVVKSIATREIPGFGELFRWLSFSEIGTSTIQSRALGVLLDSTLVFALPGSNGAVRTAMEKILIPQLDVRHRPCNFAELLPRVKPSQKKT